MSAIEKKIAKEAVSAAIMAATIGDKAEAQRHMLTVVEYGTADDVIAVYRGISKDLPLPEERLRDGFKATQERARARAGLD